MHHNCRPYKLHKNPNQFSHIPDKLTNVGLCCSWIRVITIECFPHESRGSSLGGQTIWINMFIELLETLTMPWNQQHTQLLACTHILCKIRTPVLLVMLNYWLRSYSWIEIIAALEQHTPYGVSACVFQISLDTPVWSWEFSIPSSEHMIYVLAMRWTRFPFWLNKHWDKGCHE